MRLLAFILIWVSLAVGVVAATTAYIWVVPPAGVNAPEHFKIGTGAGGEPVYAVLAADAGRGADGTALVGADTALTHDVVARLQEGGVERVRVKTFMPARWTRLPHFGVACVGLLAGAILTRLGAARAARLAEAAGAARDELSPDAALKQLRAAVRTLLDDLPGLGDDEQACRAVTQRLGDAIGGLVPSIVGARDRLVARMGMGGYARFMDTFSAAERNVNRAWSAAADNVLEESVDALERASERFAVAEDKLTGRAPSLLPLA